MNNTSFFKKPVFLASLLILVAIVVAACQPAPTAAPAPAATNPPAATAVPAATEASNSAPASEATINVATDAKLGKILVDGKGMTLYMFTKDGPDKSNCGGGCLKAWPPLLTQGKPVLGQGVDPALIGSAKMADGSMIVTYNKMPLYYWKGDAKAGDTTGQNNSNVWFVVSPDGKAVGMAAPVPVTGDTSAKGALLNVATDAKLGKILVDEKGMTLYMFTKDGPDQSNCSGGCLKAWPPFLTQGKPTAGTGVDASLLGTAKLADGSMIVTYNKMPLYYWTGDTKPGDASGQGVSNVWYVVSPDGKPVKPMAAKTGSGY